MIKELFDVAPLNSIPFNKRYNLYGWLMVLIPFLGIPALILAGPFGVVITISACIICIMMMINKQTNIEDHRNDIYFEYLNGVDKHKLIKSVSSPEISERSKRSIVSYLSSNHPGWSLK